MYPLYGKLVLLGKNLWLVFSFFLSILCLWILIMVSWKFCLYFLKGSFSCLFWLFFPLSNLDTFLRCLMVLYCPVTLTVKFRRADWKLCVPVHVLPVFELHYRMVVWLASHSLCFLEWFATSKGHQYSSWLWMLLVLYLWDS